MTDQRNDGIKAKNQDFRRYEGVTKNQDYHLSEQEGAEAFDDDYVIETCDLREFFEGGSSGRKSFSEKLGGALEAIGFAVLSGHGVDPRLYDEAASAVQDLFESTSLTDRMRFEAKRHGSVNQGYFPIKETTQIHPDLVEGWVFCRRAFDLDGDPEWRAEDYWPHADYEKVFRNVVGEHEGLILPIMQSILAYLGCDPHLYDDQLTKTNFGFRLNYYPPVSQEDDSTGAGRMLGHEDVDLFTLLPAQQVDGLQVYNRLNGKWIRLNPEPGNIILNTGDYMQRITNDRLPSTTHRVSKPREKAFLRKPRITIPMAVYLWEEEMLEVLPCLENPRYEPVSAIKFHTGITSKYYGDSYAVQK